MFPYTNGSTAATAQGGYDHLRFGYHHHHHAFSSAVYSQQTEMNRDSFDRHAASYANYPHHGNPAAAIQRSGGFQCEGYADIIETTSRYKYHVAAKYDYDCAAGLDLATQIGYKGSSYGLDLAAAQFGGYKSMAAGYSLDLAHMSGGGYRGSGGYDLGFTSHLNNYKGHTTGGLDLSKRSDIYEDYVESDLKRLGVNYPPEKLYLSDYAEKQGGVLGEYHQDKQCLPGEYSQKMSFSYESASVPAMSATAQACAYDNRDDTHSCHSVSHRNGGDRLVQDNLNQNALVSSPSVVGSSEHSYESSASLYASPYRQADVEKLRSSNKQSVSEGGSGSGSERLKFHKDSRDVEDSRNEEAAIKKDQRFGSQQNSSLQLVEVNNQQIGTLQQSSGLQLPAGNSQQPVGGIVQQNSSGGVQHHQQSTIHQQQRASNGHCTVICKNNTLQASGKHKSTTEVLGWSSPTGRRSDQKMRDYYPPQITTRSNLSTDVSFGVPAAVGMATSVIQSVHTR